MPRAKYSEVLKHGTTAEFLAWARNLSNALKACLTQTNDTGQVNWDNVSALPATNLTPHYEIYRFDDPVQASVPVFIRVEYGTAAVTGRPMIAITAGGATNGAGVLSGAAYQPRTTSPPSGIPIELPVTTYVCYKDGAFTLAWGMNSSSANAPKFTCVIDRTRDASGAATDAGLLAVASTAALSGTTRSFSRYTNSVVVTGPTCMMPVDLAGVSVNSSALGVVNLYNWYCQTPDMQYITALLGYKDREIAKGTELDVAMIGSAPRHYVCLGADGFYGSALNSSGAPAAADTHAILWEV